MTRSLHWTIDLSFGSLESRLESIFLYPMTLELLVLISQGWTAPCESMAHPRENMSYLMVVYGGEALFRDCSVGYPLSFLPLKLELWSLRSDSLLSLTVSVFFQ